jgi:NTP pyrophosphatase (non-canonical NTP hydrolase)
MKDDIDVDLYKLWIQQQNYNADIRKIQTKTDGEWMINYILGTMSELAELLEQMNWKQHRFTTINSFGPNVEEELADVTKYILSMWQLLGHTPQTMINAMAQKGMILNQLLKQETNPIPNDKMILMLDLDGCVADFRTGFYTWLSSERWNTLLRAERENSNLHLDIEQGWEYTLYQEAKLEFEKAGGYSFLPPIQPVIDRVNALAREGWYVIACTARPFSQYKRIWKDTWIWLQEHHVKVNELHFGGELRIQIAKSYSECNLVIAIEDDPIMIERYNSCNISTLMVPHIYNQGCERFPNVSPLEIAESI